uniref:2Fe-2S ferredoxin-type domain-containing protein n=1 Tax=Kalanchoe fedtschenkoi TaxID=63787 RepID=A0A7N0UBG0_KALFE
MSYFSRRGVCMLRELARGICSSRPGQQRLQRPSSQCIRPLPSVNSYMRAFDVTSFCKQRHFCTSSTGEESSQETEEISVTFVDKDGEEKTIKVPIGWSILEAAHANDIDLEGACEASLACSTCHVIVMDVDYYNKLEEPTDEENDMLDLAFGLTETSRLGCQVIAKRELDGIRLAIPSATRNFAVDGFVPKPH